MAELGLLHCWSTFPAVPRENARKTDKALVKLISKITKINYPDGILSSFEEIGRLPGPPPFRLDPGAVLWSSRLEVSRGRHIDKLNILINSWFDKLVSMIKSRA